MFNTLKYYKLWFVISGLLLAFGIFSLVVYRLELGIDFTGGTLMQLEFAQSGRQNDVRTALETSGLSNFQVQEAGEKTLLIRSEQLGAEKRQEIFEKLKTTVGEFTELETTEIGGVVSEDLRSGAFYQLLLVSFGIVLYIAYAFRRVPKPLTSWRFGGAAIIALLHDLLFVLGVFSLLGHFRGVQIDSMFVTAMLTVLGFSVHDTIVVFDRIRENLKVYAGQSLEFVVNHSIAQTIVRSLNTSLTVLFVLLAMLLFGGESIRYFVLALFIGIIVGTYSSIFIATPVLVLWQKWAKK